MHACAFYECMYVLWFTMYLKQNTHMSYSEIGHNNMVILQHLEPQLIIKSNHMVPDFLL